MVIGMEGREEPALVHMPLLSLVNECFQLGRMTGASLELEEVSFSETSLNHVYTAWRQWSIKQ